MRIKRMHKRMSIALLVFTITVMVVFNESARPVWIRSVTQSVSSLLDPNQLYNKDDIDINENDVLVVVNIPETGILPVTDHIVRHSELERPCSCKHYRTKCQCLNKNGYQWMFNAYNTTGFVCGEHASYNDIKYRCPMDYWMRTTGKDRRAFRRYHLMTMLREPIYRFISEWQELTTRDAYFLNEPRLWRKEPVELQKKGMHCLLGKRMAAITLDDFVNCPSNPASNRMTKMLANVQYVDALKIQSEMKYKQALLLSAQNVLRRTAFFGLQHRQNDTQVLLEEVLGVKLNKSLNFKVTDYNFEKLSPATKHKILMANDLDIKLYAFAKELFEARLAQWRLRHYKPSTTVEKKVELPSGGEGESTLIVNSEVGKTAEEEEKDKAAVAGDEEEEDDYDDGDDDNDGEEEDGEEDEDYDDEDEEAEEDEDLEDEDDEAEQKKELEDEDEEDEEDGKDVKKEEAKDDKDEDEDGEAKNKLDSKTTTPKPSPDTSGTKTTSKPTGEGNKEDAKEKDTDEKQKNDASGKSDQGSPAKTDGTGSVSKPVTIKPMSEDVNEFFSKLEDAKASEKSQGTPEAGSTAAKSLDGSASGSGQNNPSLGEKFRQLQGHPTNKPNIILQQDQQSIQAAVGAGQVEEGNGTVTDEYEQPLNGSSIQQAQIILEIEGDEGQSQNGTGESLLEQQTVDSSNATTDSLPSASNVSIEISDGFLDPSAMDSTPASTVERLSAGVGQLLTAKEPEYRFDLTASSDAKVGQAPGDGMTSQTGDASVLADGKKESELSMDEFTFGGPLEGSKDGLSIDDVAAPPDMLADKEGLGNMDSTLDSSKAMEAAMGKLVSLDENALKTMPEKDLNIAGLGLQQGGKDSSNAGELDASSGLDWDGQSQRESVSPMEPETGMGDSDSGLGFTAGRELDSKQGLRSGEPSAAGLGGNTETAEHLAGKSANDDADMDGLAFGAEESADGTGRLSEFQDLEDVGSRSAGGEGLSAEAGMGTIRYRDGPNLNRPDSGSVLTAEPGLKYQGREGLRVNRVVGQPQGGMNRYGMRLPINADDIDSDRERQLWRRNSNFPTARFRINPALRSGRARVSRSEFDDFENFDEQPGRVSLRRTTLPIRSPRRVRMRRSAMRRRFAPGYAPLNAEEKEVRSMFV